MSVPLREKFDSIQAKHYVYVQSKETDGQIIDYMHKTRDQ